MSEEFLKSPLSASDPQGYLDAPSLMVTSRKSAEPNTVEQSVVAVREYQPLSAQDLQVVQRELVTLSGRLEEVEQQLGIERKMGEAASLLGRLHQTKGETNKRKSLFKPSSKRLSRQADEEAQVSQDRANRLEFARTELTARKMILENRILRHHAAVLSKALSGEPLTPRPLSVALSGQFSLPLPHETPERSPRRQSRQISAFEFEANAPTNSNQGAHTRTHSRSLSGQSHGAPEFTMRSPSRPRSRNTSISTLANSFGEPDPSGELAVIAKKIQVAFPSMTPNPNKSAYILGAFDQLLREQNRHEKVIESLQLQAEQAEQRVAFLSEKTRAPNSETSPESARLLAENKQMKTELDEARRRQREFRDRLEVQRGELSRVTKELEDVTNIAVRNETYIRSLDEVNAQLEHQTEQQQAKLAEKWGNTLVSQQPSVLCKEFRKIIHELSQQHLSEMRELRLGKLSQGGHDTIQPPKGNVNAPNGSSKGSHNTKAAEGVSGASSANGADDADRTVTPETVVPTSNSTLPHSSDEQDSDVNDIL